MPSRCRADGIQGSKQIADKQGQKAGDHSQQIQAGGDVVVAGLSAADVVEITRTEVARVLGELSLTAKDLAEERIEKLASHVVEHFRVKPELFQAFGEPDFQYSLQDAGRAAASNDEQHTEQLLVDLLANRAEQGDSTRVRLATSQAIRAADKLSCDMLNGVTALWTVHHVSWSDPTDFPGHLGGILSVTQKLVEIGLPQNRAWLQDGDALNLLRTSPGGILTRKAYREMIQGKLAIHLVPGVNAEDEAELLGQAEELAPGFVDQLRVHPLKQGFIVLPGTTQEQMIAALPSDPASVEVFHQLADRNGYGVLDPTAVEKLDALLKEFQAVETFAQWWDPLPVAELTTVGSVIGFINARRYLTLDGAQTVSDFLDLLS